MIRGIYTSGWSMLADSKKLDVVSNNLANVNTTGYKKDTVLFESFPAQLTKRIHDTTSPSNPTGNVGEMEMGRDMSSIYTYYTQGQLEKTDNPFDLGLRDDGSAFFTVEAPGEREQGNGRQFFTRDGSFTKNDQNQLVTKDGYLVLGEEGPIVIKGQTFSVQADGTVTDGDQVVGKLLITAFADTSTLRKYGNNLVEATEESVTQQPAAGVEQGYLELSNVNVIKEMVDMISVMRSYEASQKLLQMQDGTLEKLVNEVGSLR